MSGVWLDRTRVAARRRSSASGRGLGIVHTRGSNSASGYGKASAWTSCGRASVTAPVSAGDVRTRIASGSAAMICSGRLIRSQYRDTGLKQSLTDVSWEPGDSSCCNTGAGRRVAKMSPGRRSTGSRLIVAPAAPVTMFVAPGPIDVVQANVRSRSCMRAKAAAVCTIACSLRAR